MRSHAAAQRLRPTVSMRSRPSARVRACFGRAALAADFRQRDFALQPSSRLAGANESSRCATESGALPLLEYDKGRAFDRDSKGRQRAWWPHRLSRLLQDERIGRARHRGTAVRSSLLNEECTRRPCGDRGDQHLGAEHLSESVAKVVGEELATVKGATPLNAIVMASAAQRGDVADTADVSDLVKLAGYFRAVRVLGIADHRVRLSPNATGRLGATFRKVAEGDRERGACLSCLASSCALVILHPCRVIGRATADRRPEQIKPPCRGCVPCLNFAPHAACPPLRF
jgi:hypothetical protein